MMPIDAATRPVGLLGYPVDHSLSPLLHNAAFQAQGLNYVYIALPVTPGAVAGAVLGLQMLGFAGANVTVPHKQAVVPLMDECSPQANAVGAVNTIVCRREGNTVTCYGDNTDIAGFLAPLQVFADDLRGSEMLVFGAGGAARAVVYALLSTLQPSKLTLAVRTPSRAEALARDFADYDTRQALRVAPMQDAVKAVQTSTLLVNATSVGMYPHTSATPWSHAEDFSEGQIAYDLIYRPEQTRWLRDAAARGARTLGGMEMLIEQAAASYVQWTGHAMPLDVVRQTLNQHTTTLD
jgi:shikimate dehydrogenase